MVTKNSPWRLGNFQLVLILAVVEVYLQEDSFHFLFKKISAGQKDTCWQIDSRFQFLIILSNTITTSFTSRQLATSHEIVVARTEFLVALATRKAQFRTLPWKKKWK